MMLEAEITCECPAIQLADIQMALTRGMVVYLAEGRARVSKDLQRAIRAKGVTVKYVQRFRDIRSVPPAPLPPPPPARVQAVPLAEGLDLEALAQRVADLVSSRVLAALDQGLTVSPRTNFQGPVGPAVVPSFAVPDAIPVFIPSKIGRDDLQPADVKATAGEAGSVLDAVAALKAARKGKGR